MRSFKRMCAGALAASLVTGVGVRGDAVRAADPMLARQLTDKAIEAQVAGDHQRALTLFDEAIVEVDHPKIRYFRAKSLDALGRREEALVEFRRLVGVAEVEKYASEIATFIRAIERDEQIAELAAALDRERTAREAAERQREAAETRAEETAIKVLQSRRSGLLPPSESRLRLGPVSARMVPAEPTFAVPTDEALAAFQRAEVKQYLDRFDRYDTERMVAGVLGGVALAGIGTGAGLAFGFPADDPARDTYRQAGLATGIVGVVAALAAAVVWPSAPDGGLKSDPLASSR